MSRTEGKRMDIWFFVFCFPGIAVLGDPFPGAPTPRPHIQMTTLLVGPDYTGSYQGRSLTGSLCLRLTYFREGYF